MLEKLKEPFVRVKNRVKNKILNFFSPIRRFFSKIKSFIPGSKGFAGSEDMAEPLVVVPPPQKQGIKARVGNFFAPIKRSVSSLMGMFPSAKAFTGSEEASEVPATEKKPGIWERLKNFKRSLNGLSDFQKILLLIIAICLPAGILIATLLVKFLKNRNKK